MINFLKDPNVDIGILMFYFVFIIIIPALLLIYTDYLKFYMPIIIGLANVLTNSMSPMLFKKLYDLKSNDILTIISTHFIILYSFIGLFWLTISYSQTGVKLTTAIFYGIFLYVIVYILANEPLLYIVNKSSDKIESGVNNWAKLIIGCIYVSLLLLLVIFISKLTNIADKQIKIPSFSKKIATISKASNNNVNKLFSLSSVNKIFK